MTIIEPNKNIKSRKSNLLLIGSVAALFGVALWSIIIYNQIVSLSRATREAEDSLQVLITKNAELKNTSYTVIDSKSLHAIANRYGLVKVKNPEYLELGSQSELASNR